jgi:hypothetical protein
LALLLFLAGCGGFQGSHTVSPLSFFLPGLLKADPPPAQVMPLPDPVDPQPKAEDPLLKPLFEKQVAAVR